MTVVPRRSSSTSASSCGSPASPPDTAPGRHDNSAGADFARGSAPERHHNSAGADFARGSATHKLRRVASPR